MQLKRCCGHVQTVKRQSVRNSDKMPAPAAALGISFGIKQAAAEAGKKMCIRLVAV
jgi:hypothetical protein